MGEYAGRLSERVRLERRVGAAEGVAGSGHWEMVAERWALVEPMDRQDPSAAVAETRMSDRRWRITLRTGLPVQLSMRLCWRGLSMRLEGIEADPSRPDRLVLIARQQGS